MGIIVHKNICFCQGTQQDEQCLYSQTKGICNKEMRLASQRSFSLLNFIPALDHDCHQGFPFVPGPAQPDISSGIEFTAHVFHNF